MCCLFNDHFKVNLACDVFFFFLSSFPVINISGALLGLMRVGQLNKEVFSGSLAVPRDSETASSTSQSPRSHRSEPGKKGLSVGVDFDATS